ncbi:MAG: nicotinamide-nucleotide amidohydrolase family protein [Proteobacteria bacterium]|nr:nicotinamide-nucleotide amidohydrolase family protein [Pseudomonadota bacterium]
MHDDTELTRLAAEVGDRLREAGMHLVTAESCTGGWIAKCCTDVPGSSAWFDCGYVTYSDAAKVRDLGVDAKTIETQGAVSSPTVEEMAMGALRLTEADIAVAVSGIAGPTGAVASKPVGTVWFAVAQRRGVSIESNCRVKFFKGDRDAVRRKSVEFALGMVRAIEL